MMLIKAILWHCRQREITGSHCVVTLCTSRKEWSIILRLETRKEPRFEGCRDRWTFAGWKIDFHREAEKNTPTAVENIPLQKLEANTNLRETSLK